MLYLTTTILLFGFSSSAPLDNCDAQSDCLITEIVEQADGYEICLYWDSGLSGCDKKDSISHACDGPFEANKTENFEEGRAHRMCQTVDCDGYGIFGLKDGKGCKGATNEYAFSGIRGIYCTSGSDGGYCGGGNKEDCMWAIPAPECKTEPIATTTTTTAPGTTFNDIITETTRSGAQETTMKKISDPTTTVPDPTTTDKPVDCTFDTDPCSMHGWSSQNCENDNFQTGDVTFIDMTKYCQWNGDTQICERKQCVYDNSDKCVAHCGCDYIQPPMDTCAVKERQGSDVGAYTALMRVDEYDDEEFTVDQDMYTDGFFVKWVYLYYTIAAVGAVLCLCLLGIMVTVYIGKHNTKYNEDVINMTATTNIPQSNIVAVEMTTNPMNPMYMN